MSRKYEHGDIVPTNILADRLTELSNAIHDCKDARDREFTMRIPAELDRDADLVLMQSSSRLYELQAENERLRAKNLQFEHAAKEVYDDLLRRGKPHDDEDGKGITVNLGNSAFGLLCDVVVESE